jgi:DNA segregation ATPase FtsK/SpoIIIE, S-DNA-T family
VKPPTQETVPERGLARKGTSDLSVTEVRNALRCPRIFALGRARGKAVVFPVGASSLGATFHRIAERFARDLEAPPAAVRRLQRGAAREAVAAAFGAWLLGHLVAALDESPALASMPGEVDDLAEALRELGRYLAAEVERGGMAPAEALRSLVPHAELEVEAVIDVPGSVPVRIAGRVDAVHSRGTGALDVVEYKLTDESNQELDQAQVALYRRLLRACLDVEAEPVILRFNPGLIVTRLSPSAADAIVEKRILPLLGRMIGWAEQASSAPATPRRDLCATCPVRVECAETYGDRLDARDLPPASAVQPRPGPEGRLGVAPVEEPVAPPAVDAEGEASVEELEKQIVTELRRLGVMVQVARRTVGPTLLRVEVVIARQRVAQLDRLAQDVEHHLAAREVRFDREGAKRVFTAPRRPPRAVELRALLAKKAAFLRARPGRFVVGEGIDGEVVAGDLSDGSTCHLLIGGQTGSGKSVLLRGIVSSLCHFHPPSAIRFTLVDPKRVTFGSFAAGIAAHLEGPVFYDGEALLPELDDLVAEMEARYERFEHAKVQDIDEYNEAAKEPLARRVVVVDEFQDLLADKATRQPFLDGIKRLGAKARAAGIHLVCATQRPDRNTVPGEIKANLGGKIALRVQAAVNSRIILDQPGAERLLGRGDLLADLGHGVVRAQAPLA